MQADMPITGPNGLMAYPVYWRATNQQTMKAHKHAALMAEYAKDAAETETPWKRWEVAGLAGDFRNCTEHPEWEYYMQYRRKTRTININGFEVPEPLREAPKEDTEVFLLNVCSQSLVDQDEYWNTPSYNRILGLGIMHLTREAAEIHARALLSFTARERKEGA